MNAILKTDPTAGSLTSPHSRDSSNINCLLYGTVTDPLVRQSVPTSGSVTVMLVGTSLRSEARRVRRNSIERKIRNLECSLAYYLSEKPSANGIVIEDKSRT